MSCRSLNNNGCYQQLSNSNHPPISTTTNNTTSTKGGKSTMELVHAYGASSVWGQPVLEHIKFGMATSPTPLMELKFQCSPTFTKKKAKLEEALEELVKVEAERVASQKRMHLEETLAQFAISHAQVMDETRVIFQSQATILQSQATQIQNQAAQLRSLELQLG